MLKRNSNTPCILASITIDPVANTSTIKVPIISATIFLWSELSVLTIFNKVYCKLPYHLFYIISNFLQRFLSCLLRLPWTFVTDVNTNFFHCLYYYRVDFSSRSCSCTYSHISREAYFLKKASDVTAYVQLLYRIDTPR